MGVVKSALEKAMEKIKEVEALSPEELARMKAGEMLKTVLADYYKGDITKEDLRERLKGSDLSVLVHAQESMASSIRLGIFPEELGLRREGILAVESLKARPDISSIENLLDAVSRLQEEYAERREGAVEEMRKAIEQNPQMQVRPVRTPDGRTVLQATPSIDEAVQARLADYMNGLDESYGEMFSQIMERLMHQIRKR